MSTRNRKDKTATRLSHVGREPSRQHGFVNTPIYRGSTVLFPSMAAIEANDQAYTYGRTGTPTVRALEEAIAELEGLNERTIKRDWQAARHVLAASMGSHPAG